MDRTSDKEKRMARDVQGSPVENRKQVSVINTAEAVLTTSNKQTTFLSIERWQEWQDKWKWLFCKNDNIGCRTCRDVDRLVDIGRGIKISAEWSQGSVGVGKQ